MSKELKAEINKGYNTFKVFEALKEKLGDLESIESATKGAEKLKAKLEKDIEKLEQNRRGLTVICLYRPKSFERLRRVQQPH